MDVRAVVLAAAPGAPAVVADALAALADGLRGAAGENLSALVLYGGLARGSYRPGRSDVNVAVVLEDASPPALIALAAPLREAYRAARVEPFIVGRAELPRLAALFPTKLLGLQSRHVLLAGEDPFRGIAPPAELLRLRAEQALRNLTLRLRRRIVGSAGDPDAQVRWVAEVARPLAAELAPLLDEAGVHPASDDTAALLAAAARAFGLDAATLAELAAARKAPEAVDDPAALLSRALEVVAASAEAVRALGRRADAP